MATHGYGDTLKHRGLQPFLWTQFLGAFNDNLFKIVVSMLAVHAATQAHAGKQLSLVGVVFIQTATPGLARDFETAVMQAIVN